MNLRTQIRILYLISAVLLACGLLLLLERYHRVDASLVDKKNDASTAIRVNQETQPTKMVSLEKFKPLWRKRLQGEPAKPELPKPNVVQKIVPDKKAAVAKPEVKLPKL